MELPTNIGRPAIRALQAAGYKSLNQLTSTSEAELLKLHGVGPKALRLLKEALEAEGLSFAANSNGSARRKPAASSNAAHSEVAKFMAELKHARKDEIEFIRATILGADKGLTERIKWNAPSFGYGDEDRVTFTLRPKDRVQLIFHRGAKVKAGDGFSFEDPTGLLEWAAPDRGVLAFSDMDDVKAKRSALVKLVKAWLRATQSSIP